MHDQNPYASPQAPEPAPEPTVTLSELPRHELYRLRQQDTLLKFVAGMMLPAAWLQLTIGVNQHSLFLSCLTLAVGFLAWFRPRYGRVLGLVLCLSLGVLTLSGASAGVMYAIFAGSGFITSQELHFGPRRIRSKQLAEALQKTAP